MWSRREFLKSASVVSLSPMLPCFLKSAAGAAKAPDARVLVVIQLDGGNDGINTVVPFADDGYGRARKKLRLDTAKLHKLNHHVGLHPSMGAAKELFDNGRLAIVQGVGYPNPDRSHFRSMKIWQTARFDNESHNGYGWLGRTLDRLPGRAESGRMANAIFVGEQETPLALWGRQSNAAALSRADDLYLHESLVVDPSFFHAAPKHDSLQRFVTTQVLAAYGSAVEFQRKGTGSRAGDGSSYPDTPLGAQLKLVSQLLQGGAEARVYYTAHSGYDTHSAQLYQHARLLREFSEALKAFLDDLKASRMDNRVVVLSFSEFGRRVSENDSQGTDHGTAGPVFLAGSAVSGGLKGKTPDLTDLDQGDLKMHTDFRHVYATVLEQWFGVGPTEILGGSFGRLALFSA